MYLANIKYNIKNWPKFTWVLDNSVIYIKLKIHLKYKHEYNGELSLLYSVFIISSM